MWIQLLESIRFAIQAIVSNKLRASLTTLGIIIGITSVTTMATVVNGIEADFDESMSKLGADVLYIEKWPWAGGPGFKWWEYINRPQMTPDLAEVLVARSDLVTAAAPVVRTSRTVSSARERIPGIRIYGTWADLGRVKKIDVVSGRMFTDYENTAARSVAVLGHEVAATLFPQERPLGKRVRIGTHAYEVIGVLAQEGRTDDSDDVKVYVPYGTFKSDFGESTYRDISIQVKVLDPSVVPLAKDEITGILRVARGLDAGEENNFEINEQASLREQLAPIKATIYAIGIGLTALSLLVGGIGVMNIMFVSVKERTREIGIRKALGAPRQSILTQFLVEAIVICLFGGILGIVFAIPLSLLVQLVLPSSLDVGTIGIAFVICVAIGAIFGLAPAWSAAKAVPIEALRYE